MAAEQGFSSRPLTVDHARSRALAAYARPMTARCGQPLATASACRSPRASMSMSPDRRGADWNCETVDVRADPLDDAMWRSHVVPLLRGAKRPRQPIGQGAGRRASGAGRGLNELDDHRGTERLTADRDAERARCVGDRVDHRWRRCDRAAFSHPLVPTRIGGSGRLDVPVLEDGHFGPGGEIVDEGGDRLGAVGMHAVAEGVERRRGLALLGAGPGASAGRYACSLAVACRWSSRSAPKSDGVSPLQVERRPVGQDHHNRSAPPRRPPLPDGAGRSNASVMTCLGVGPRLESWSCPPGAG